MNQKTTNLKNAAFVSNPNALLPSDLLPNDLLKNAHGAIPYGMTNDYMFRAVFQTNNKALHGLICSLLHLHEEDILSVEITNPIILGQSIKSKEFRLDINVTLNNFSHINLEMQVTGRLIWSNRSVSYLCRSFDMLNHGQDYAEVKPVIHIGFLDYTLFDDYPEFYATYKLLNVKNHHLYSDNLTLSVVDLSHIELATDDDKEYHIYDWAKLFKATTWEEIKMLAAKDPYINEASKTIFQLSAEEQILKRCRDREEYYLDLRAYEREVAENKKMLEEKEKIISEKDIIIAEDKKALSESKQIIAEKEKTIKELLSEIEMLKSNTGK
ncbi:MAG: Rpn family recombination-promoting nuclease/putative transposase [Clostridium sp.]|nr:Rpn family recombination-promoting nuclease/putative transposase [Clostridium sp.]